MNEQALYISIALLLLKELVAFLRDNFSKKVDELEENTISIRELRVEMRLIREQLSSLIHLANEQGSQEKPRKSTQQWKS